VTTLLARLAAFAAANQARFEDTARGDFRLLKIGRVSGSAHPEIGDFVDLSHRRNAVGQGSQNTEI